jgi:hypothetical protein
VEEGLPAWAKRARELPRGLLILRRWLRRLFLSPHVAPVFREASLPRSGAAPPVGGIPSLCAHGFAAGWVLALVQLGQKVEVLGQRVERLGLVKK